MEAATVTRTPYQRGGVMATKEVPQHLEALALANRIRISRSQIKQRIASGELAAAAVVRDTPWECLNMSVSELLQAQNRWGKTRARRLLVSLVISENRPLGRLTIRQREALAQELT